METKTQVIPGERPAAVTRHRLRVVVTAGPDAGKSMVSGSGSLALGTAEGNPLVLTDPTLSRFHAELSRDPRGLRLRDLESTNGSFVENVRILDAFLELPATVRLGVTSLRIELSDEQEQQPLHPDDHFGDLAGRSIAMRALFAQLEQLSKTQVTVLVQGESGTGKELAAEALHRFGTRPRGPFVIVDCASIPSELVESELFGHEKGAFTGASQERVGALEAADGGTVFLDEIGELPLALQPKLLRALERRQIKRVGSNQFRGIDVRFIAATHRDLRAQVNQGAFREDLFFRLAVAAVRIPPLREHLEDLPLLLERLWTDACRTLGAAGGTYVPPSAATLRQLEGLPWEGNVRELRNFVERSVALSGALDSARITVPGAAAPAPASADETAPAIHIDLPYKDAKEAWVSHFEAGYLRQRLAQAQGNVSEMAREAEIDRAYVIKLLRKHGLR